MDSIAPNCSDDGSLAGRKSTAEMEDDEAKGRSVSFQENGEAKKDGLISHENEELRDRVTNLEKKVESQEDEIVCLKSALSDCIRRLAAIESVKASQNNLLPSKTAVKATPRKTSSHPPSAKRSVTDGPSSLSQANRHTSPSPQKGSPRNSATSPAMKKWPSASNDIDTKQNGHAPNFRRAGSLGNLHQRPPITFRGAKDPAINKEEGTIRIFLRGRPVTTYAPTDLADNYDLEKVGEPSSEKLKLEWVYGYRGRDCRSNVYLLPTGEVVYFIASVVVLYNVEEQMQRHYLGHNDDVKCLAIHPDKITIATGQVAGHDKGGRPHVRVWDSVGLNTLHVIGLGEFERAVSCISFSKVDGGQYLVCIDDANEHILSVWDWQKGDKGHKITETKCSTEPVLVAECHPFEKNVVVTAGKSHLCFWTLEGGSLVKKQGIYDKYDKPKFTLSICFSENGDLLTGDSNGNIFVWPKGTNKISHAILNAHEGGIFSLCILKDGSLLSGGGKDRKIVQWDSSYNKTGNESELPESYGPVRTLSQGRGNMILVGTTRNSILQGTLQLEFSPIVQGHMDELWGLSVHPNQHQFLTSAYDKNIYLWDSLTHTAVWCKEINDPAQCACFHPEAEVVAIGCQNGRWLVIDLTARDIVAVHTDGNEQIECMEFSPDGKMIAIGSRDNYVYVYSTTDGGRKYSRIGRCTGHSSFITHLDWSQDSQYLMTNSGDYEILYWASNNCNLITNASALRDVKWATQNCSLSFNTIGVWPDGADGTDVNGCCRSNNQTLIASADDFGKVNLYKYPSCQPKASAHIYGGHSSHVTSVRFLHDDSRLISTGGRDMAILQWEVI